MKPEAELKALAVKLAASLDNGEWDNFSGGWPENFAGKAARDLQKELARVKRRSRELVEAILCR